MCSSKLDLYKFVKEPSDRLKCMVCYELPQVPLQHEDCGKVFCKACIDKNGVRPCPNCRGRNRNYFTDRRCAQEIAELPVLCSNTRRGCPWEGTIDTVKGHTRTCTFVPACCPNGCDFSGKLLLEHLDSHLRECPNRIHTCEHCGKNGTYATITQKHDKDCPKKLIPCLQCSHVFERRMMSEHLKTSCKCKEFSNPTRKNMEFKETKTDKVTETDIATREIGKKDNREMRNLPNAKNDPMMPIHGSAHTISLPGYSKMTRNKQRFHSLPFYLHEKYKMRLVVNPHGHGQAKGAYLSVFVELLPGHYDDELHWPFHGIISIALLNQASPNYHHERSIDLISSYYDVARGVAVAGINNFTSHEQMSAKLNDRIKYLVDDTIMFRVKVVMQNVPQRALKRFKYAHMDSDVRDPANEQFTFQVQDYSAEDDYVSEYSLKDGYNVVVQIFTKTDYLSLLVRVERKPDTSSLNQFKGVIQVELLNQLEDQNHHTKLLRVAQRNSTTGTASFEESDFIHWTSLALSFGIHGNTWYLAKDSLFFRVTVSMDKQDYEVPKESQPDLKPWLECNTECWRS